MVNLHIQAARKVRTPKLPPIEAATRPVEEARLDNRKVWFTGALIECNIYNRAQLQSGHTLKGPAIIQEVESTTVVSPGWQLRVDQIGNLVIKTMQEPIGGYKRHSNNAYQE